MAGDKHLVQGRQAEELACRYLEQQGMQVVQRNYRCAAGELDLIMREGVRLVFVEVRYRKNDLFGSGADSVNWRKQRRIIAAAWHYLQRQRATTVPCRIDVISVCSSREGPRVEWIQDAFRA